MWFWVMNSVAIRHLHKFSEKLRSGQHINLVISNYLVISNHPVTSNHLVISNHVIYLLIFWRLSYFLPRRLQIKTSVFSRIRELNFAQFVGGVHRSITLVLSRFYTIIVTNLSKTTLSKIENQNSPKWRKNSRYGKNLHN
jgi:hypothetical protein